MPVLRNVGRQLEVGDVVNRLGHTLSQTCRTVGVHITVECPVDSTAAGHAALDAAVAEVRRQLDMLGPSRSRVVLVDGPEAQDARG